MTITNQNDHQVAKFSVFDGIKWTSVQSTSTITENWSFLSSTFDGEFITMFVNGTQEAILEIPGTQIVSLTDGNIETVTVDNISSEKDIVIGASLITKNEKSTPSKIFSGEINDVLLYDYVLTAQQIFAMYEQTKSVYALLSVPELTIEELLAEIKAEQLENETTVLPTNATTVLPTNATTVLPTNATTVLPTNATTVLPTNATTVLPTNATTVLPTNATTVLPTNATTVLPTNATTVLPTNATTVLPTNATTVLPTNATTVLPTNATTVLPTNATTVLPTNATDSIVTEIQLEHDVIEIGKEVTWSHDVVFSNNTESKAIEIPVDAEILLIKTMDNSTETILYDSGFEEIVNSVQEEIDPLSTVNGLSEDQDISNKDLNKYFKLVNSAEKIQTKIDGVNEKIAYYADLDTAKAHKKLDKLEKQLVTLDNKLDKKLNKLSTAVPLASLDSLSEKLQDDMPLKMLIVNDTANNIELKFKTPAPYTSEINQSTEETYNKKVTVAHDSTLHYTNVKSYSDIPEKLVSHGVEFKLFWNINETKTDVTNDPRFNVQFVDTNGNKIADRMEWIVPQLSEQEFEIEADIVIINVQSYPTVGETWTVYFTTTGTADLTITGIQGTTFGNNSPDDLKFLELNNGTHVLTPTIDGNSIIYENYSSNGQGFEISKVLTQGKHHLEFKFGNDVAHANNAAGPAVILLRGASADVMNNAEQDVDFTTEDRVDSGTFDHTTDDEVEVLSDGTYRISYGLNATSSGTTNNHRYILYSHLAVNDVDSKACHGGGYMRFSNGANDVVTQSECVLELSANDKLTVVARKEGTNTANTVSLVGAGSWFQVQKIESPEVIILREDANTSSLTTGNVTINWTVQENSFPTDTFTHSTTANPQNIVVDKAGLYKVSYSVGVNGTAGRSGTVANLIINNGSGFADSPYGWGFAYIRGSQSTQESAITGSGIVNLAADAIVTLDLSDVGATGGETARIGAADKMQIEMEYLGENSNLGVLRIHDSANGPDIDPGPTDQLWDTQDQVDPQSFTHTSDTSDVAVIRDGLYYLSYGVYASQTFNDNDRFNYATAVMVDSGSGFAEEQACRSAAFLRGASTANSVPDAVASVGCYLELSKDDVFKIRITETSTAADSTTNSIGDQVYLTMQNMDYFPPSPISVIDEPNISDSVDLLNKFTITHTDVVLPIDFAGVGSFLSEIDAPAISDSVLIVQDLTQIISDVSSISDSIVPAGHFTFTPIDTPAITDSATITLLHGPPTTLLRGAAGDINSQTNQDITWSLTDRANSDNYDLSTSDEVEVLSDGTYRISYGLNATSTGTTTNQRYMLLSHLAVNDVDSKACYGGGYMRFTEGVNDLVAQSECVLELSTNDKLTVVARQEGSQVSNDVDLVGAGSWFQVQKIESPEVIILREDANTSSLTTANVTVNWTVQENSFPSATYTHSTTANPQNIVVDKAGLYKVSYSVGIDSTTDNSRSGTAAKLIINNGSGFVDSEYAWGFVYHRDNGAEDNIESAVTGSAIVNLAADAIVTLDLIDVGGNLQSPREGVADRMQIELEYLGTSTDNNVLRIHDSANGPDIDPGPTDQLWDTQDQVDGASFTHTVDTTDITVNRDGLYYLAYGMFNTQQSPGTTRFNSATAVMVDSGSGFAEEQACRAASFLRAASGGNFVPSSVNSVGCYLQLSANDILKVRITETSTAADLTVNTIGDRVYLTMQNVGYNPPNPISVIDEPNISDSVDLLNKFALFPTDVVVPTDIASIGSFLSEIDAPNISDSVVLVQDLIEPFSDTSSISDSILATGHYEISVIDEPNISDSDDVTLILGSPVVLLRGAAGDIMSNTDQDITWSTEDRLDSGSFAHSTSDEVEVLSTGTYRISYGLNATSSGSTDDQRYGIISHLEINDVDSQACYGGGYMRFQDGVNDLVAQSECVLELSANDRLTVEARKDGSQTANTVSLVGAGSWFQVQEIESPEVIILREDSDTTAITTGNATINWTVQENSFPAGTYTHSTTANPQNIVVDKAGFYKISYSLGIDTGAGQSGTAAKLIINNGSGFVDSDYGTGFTYLRNLQGVNDNALSGSAIVNLAADAIVTLDLFDVGGSSTSRTGVANEMQIDLEYLGTGTQTNVLQIFDDANGPDIDPGPTDQLWDTNNHISDASYSHTEDSSDITINKAGLYYLTYGIFATQASGNLRFNYATTVLVNSGSGFAEENACRAATYLRGSTDIPSSAATASCYLQLSENDIVKVHITETSTGSDSTVNSIGNRVYLAMHNVGYIPPQPISAIDAPNISDSGIKNRAISAIDAPNVIDTTSKSITQTLEDNITVSDNLNTESMVTQSLSDTITVSDNLNTESMVTQSLSDTITVSDNLNTESMVTQSLSDTITVSDNLNTESMVTQSLSDTITVSDNLNTESMVTQSLSDTSQYLTTSTQNLWLLNLYLILS